ncbi:archaeosortase C [Candidatus Aciduliprofundum boonei]|uniref:Exosortase EpsH-related protein n=1 Tax=Aciduliprofundum boonei (strain DSM 19572 / T469) TaxID=439481 RepID=B5IDJ5_ACIB4|nr:archaeosortase C [Candidatus Aciduliprofundum boonei]ADD08070.1 Exosortase EpsH-related protein [Aciduliprofundum boonei T469]EDY35617.1 hypothetical protein ABOONEI_154 [Aciduliprofundum boonei T469]HII54511.1 archaeosortase C [Candidatus Aciduliprofundum boonei]
MNFAKMKKYIDENRYNLFIYSVLIVSMTYFISYVGMTLITVLLFLVIVVLDAKNYKKLNSKFYSVGNIPVDFIIGIILVVLPFLNYVFNPLHTSPNFGNIDVTFVLVGLAIMFYGMRDLWEFYLPVGFILAIAVFEFLMGTTLFIDILGPTFINFTIYFSTALVNLFGYGVTAGPNYFILPNGERIYMLVWCSGIESFTLFTLLMIVLLLRERIKWWAKVALIVVGAIGDLFVNVIRVTILVAIAIDYGMSIMQLFHSNLGNILFLIYVFLFYWMVIKVFVKKN